ncbi:hypothetical protein MBM_06091 [Drepanopeziza brunnea f. sp. 'multigermtubi' MB_m1]|uniref:Uncharacterized protein n=1 Tax=Marssonina brunnea f. sp. multigermtubi (strain MB_m1) TaxID=1072389 RepID=K1WF47_MARBU|nr:uncharacterized protein MBM_06091 [Drepanopeziza brunnea f. sp. 'multigermtubi' MB_m1]EKD16080.1 hypothetical protein MBM_06091 [Drepanopeziza brunnea f. sp. 'multigermtubi' MB_m1]
MKRAAFSMTGRPKAEAANGTPFMHERACIAITHHSSFGAPIRSTARACDLDLGEPTEREVLFVGCAISESQRLRGLKDISEHAAVADSPLASLFTLARSGSSVSGPAPSSNFTGPGGAGWTPPTRSNTVYQASPGREAGRTGKTSCKPTHRRSRSEKWLAGEGIRTAGGMSDPHNPKSKVVSHQWGHEDAHDSDPQSSSIIIRRIQSQVALAHTASISIASLDSPALIVSRKLPQFRPVIWTLPLKLTSLYHVSKRS